MKAVLQYAFEGQGLSRVYENGDWMIGIKNFKPANALENIDCVERHNETDELFVLLEGECTLLYANEIENDPGREIEPAHISKVPSAALEFWAIPMERGRVYNIPRGLWHTTVTMPGTKLILVEAAATGVHNSDVRNLTQPEIGAMREILLSLRRNT